MRVFKTRWFARFSRQEGTSDKSLREAIARAERGLIDADLGDGLNKQRVARQGQGGSGGYRTIIAYRTKDRAVFIYGFAKNYRGSIEPDQLSTAREIATMWLTANTERVVLGIEEGELQEIEID